MEVIFENHANLLYVLGAIALVIELTVMGLSGALLFFALGCITTGVLVSLGIVSSWQYEVLSVGLSTGLWALVLWQPLKKLQGAGKAVDTSSDMIGLTVNVSEQITANSGSIRYSGINWQARLYEEGSSAIIEAGQSVIIKGVNGTVMLVE